MYRNVLIIATFLGSLVAQAGYHHSTPGTAQTTAPDSHPGTQSIQETITQPLDPFDPKNKGTFQQRYYIDDEYASGPNAPVIYFLSNEGEMFSLIAGAGYMMEMAKSLGAHFVALEHRYYGQSIPAQFTELTAENLQYLKIKNALADYKNFEHFAKRKYKQLRGKWFTIGRSYGASLSVWYRETYPKETVGAIAAAPAINIPTASSLWDDFVVKTLGPDCVRDFHAEILDAIEYPYTHGESMADIKAEFGASNVTKDGDFLSAIGSISIFLVQMGGPEALCPLLSTQNPTEAFIQAVKATDDSFGMTLYDWTDQGVVDPKASLYQGGLGMRQWDYQTCVEVGDASIIPSDPTKTIQPTSIANYETQDAQCLKLFGIHFTAHPETGLDAEYFNPLITVNSKVKNLLITNDSDDPTSVLSVAEGQNLNPGVIVYPVQGAAHHQELATPTPSDPESFTDAREMLLNSAREWLR